MPFNINEFIGNGLQLGGARPTLFEVNVSLPSALTGVNRQSSENKFRFTCRATSIPASTVASVDVPYFGRQIKLAGDRTFADWNVTVMNDEDYLIRDTMEAWHNSINTIISNNKTIPGQNYQGSALITQYGKSGNVIKQYDFFDIFPIQVDEMGVDWESTNQIQTFGVTFAYNYWLPVVRANGTNINPTA